MKKAFLILLSVITAGFAYADEQSSLNAEQTDFSTLPLMTIDGKPVMASEFLYIYNKNNQESALEQKSIDEYVDLFINFKLKVAEAEAQGIDTTAAFVKELNGYRAQATPKYLRDDAAIDSLVSMSYGRLARDRRAAHIAIQCPMNAPDSVVEAAKALIEDARVRVTTGKSIKKGRKTVQQPKEDFFEVAREVSTDPSVQETGGELGWITPFRYVYPFETAVYTTPVGEVSEVFRSAYGFHIALIEEEREHQEVHASHIMKMVPRGNDSVKAAQKAVIDSIARIATPENFADMARTLSDDKGSAVRGGELGWFGKGRMVKPFEDTAFGMKEGEISAPFESDFGWHIIYLQGRRGIQPLDSMRAQILRQVQRDERMREAEASFIRKTRAEYKLPDSMTDSEVKAYADAHLEEKYPELQALVREYHDGILLFEVSLREVWDKAAKDTAGLTEFFAANKKNYPWDAPRYKGWFLQCKDKSTMKAAKAIIKNAEPDSVASYLEHRLNIDSTTYVKFQRGLWEKGAHPGVDKYGFKLKGAEFATDSLLPYVFCVGKVLKAPEEYTDERGKVTTDYQDYLEKLWVESLRKKYTVEVNQEVLKLIKDYE